jgi:hypothetical protein
MITNKGKQIIAKYLLGQAPEFASHLAAGSGNVPFSQANAASPFYVGTRKNLDFEMFRVPILSKGFVREDGVDKIVFKAEMPSDQRYQITEVGVFPAPKNSIANQYDSKLLMTFSTAESWLFNLTSASVTSASVVGEVNSLDNGNTGTTDILASGRVFYFNSNDRIFNDTSRKNKHEPPRFLNKALMVRGDNSSYSIENSTFNFDFSQNSPNDKIRFAISLINKSANSNSIPATTTIKIEFINNVGSRPKATYTKTLVQNDFNVKSSNGVLASRYIVVDEDPQDLVNFGIRLGSFTKDTDFSWGQINLIKITAYVSTGNGTDDQYYVCFDGMRLENENVINPLYSLVGYNVARTQNGYPIIKVENTNNYIEYRFGVDVT